MTLVAASAVTTTISFAAPCAARIDASITTSVQRLMRSGGMFAAQQVLSRANRCAQRSARQPQRFGSQTARVTLPDPTTDEKGHQRSAKPYKLPLIYQLPPITAPLAEWFTTLGARR